MSRMQPSDIAKTISIQLVRAIEFGNRHCNISDSRIEQLLGIADVAGANPGATWQGHIREHRYFELEQLSGLIDKAAEEELVPSAAASEIRLNLARLTSMVRAEKKLVAEPVGPYTAGMSYSDSSQALAMVVRLAATGTPFAFNKTDRGFEVMVAPKDADVMKQQPRSSYMLVQQGGSSSEVYLHAHETEADAEVDRIDCAENGSYETSPIVEVPAPLVELGETFYETVQGILQASKDMACVERPVSRMKL